MGEIKVYGTTWCGDCSRAKSFMDENDVDYEWTDVDQEIQFREYITNLNGGEMRVPTIIFVDGSFLVEPSNEELANKLLV